MRFLPSLPALRRAARRGRALFAALLLGGAIAGFALPAAAQSAPDDAANAFIEVSGALLGLTFDAGQRRELRALIDGYWQRQQRAQIDAVLGTREFAAQLRQRPEPLRAVALRISRPDALLTLEADARRGDAVSAWLLERYSRAHPPLAPAKPGGLPLTRDSVDGQLDLAHFMATEIHRQPAPAPGAADREWAYRAAAARHGALSAEQQVQLARAPGEAARLRYGWGRASPMDRLLGRAELGGRLTPQEAAQVQQYIASLNAQLGGMVAQHQQAVFGSALAHMRQSTDTIMGRGTVWNPSSGRWEQQGGIVTEFNGTVRVP